jgi:NADPH:quinone reductase-like Zn-dependent oxidoreductase
MKAFVLRSYGSPDSLEPAEIDRPVPAADEVLVRVHATSVNPYDWHHLRGEPRIARLMAPTMGMRGPNVRVLGCDMAGEVEAVGAGVTRFRPGDDVFALLEGGGFAEYVSVREELLAPKPANLSYEQAAAVPMAAMTALLALREKGRIRSGQTVLVNGASGGVGSFAVQIARALGATVDGVCSARSADLVRSLGVHEVIDYGTQDFTRRDVRYDVVLDIAGCPPARACRRALTREGTLVLVGGPAGRWFQPIGHTVATLAAAPLVPQRIVLANVTAHKQERQMLASLTELIEDGRVVPVIDRHYRFDEIPAAVKYQEQGHARGKVVVTI